MTTQKTTAIFTVSFSGLGNISSTKSVQNATEATLATSHEWGTEILAFEIINFCIIGITVWVLLSMIVYGTKTRRWTKTAGTSSLNSGLIYIAATAAVLGTLPRLIATQIMYHKAEMETGPNWCETMGDVSTAGYGLSLYTTYFFLCLRQRLIYAHPYVKEKVSKCMDWFSKIFFLVLTAVTLGLMVVFIYPKNYLTNEYGCQEVREESTSILLACSFIVTQGMMLTLCIYPAFRVSIKSFNDGESSTTEHGNSIHKDEVNQKDTDSPANLYGCCRFLFSCIVTSPVEMTIKRTIIYSILIVLSDISVVIIETLSFSEESPSSVRQTVVDMGSFLNIFFILATFGFAGHVLTLFFPTCPNVQTKDTTDEQTSGCSISGDTQV